MIFKRSDSSQAITNRTERIGCFIVPSVLAGFEVRSIKNRSFQYGDICVNVLTVSSVISYSEKRFIK
ncbi:hypothetical protein A6J66_021145 [Yersinia enterocolitica]|nr:hypothetical protein A6J66_021145 [Yersinia enterocolitica]